MKRCLSVILCILIVLSGVASYTVPVYAAGESDAIPAYNIIVTNNLGGKADTVYIYGVNPNDLIKIYDSASGGNIIAYGVVPARKIDITFNIKQIGAEAGSIYVSVVSLGKTESARTRVQFEGEPKSDALDPSCITITNNVGKADVIYIDGLTGGNIVKAYNKETGGKLLGARTVPANGGDAVINVPQLGSEAGSVYITVTNKNMLESDRVRADYDAEPVSNAIGSGSITVTNNVGKADTVYVEGLSGGDVVRVYNAASGGKLLGTKSVPAAGSDATVTVSQLGSSAGSVYVSITSAGANESPRIKVNYDAELATEAPDEDNITVINNAGMPDTVYVTGLIAGDIVKVYNAESKGMLLGTAKVSGQQTDATVSIPQLGSSSGSVYVSVTSAGMTESSRTESRYSSEGKSAEFSAGNIVITNNVGSADTIYVTGLSGGYVVKVYDAPVKGSLLGSATVAPSRTDATISVPQLGSSSGSVYVSVTSPGKSESGRTEAEYEAESVSDGLDANNISITNNAGAPDVIYITGLTARDVVKVYSSERGGTVLGTATVSSSKTDAAITVAQLGSAAGSVYITVTGAGKSESPRMKVDYAAEAPTDSLNADSITVSNNKGSQDTVYVSGLTPGDVIKVYSAATGGSLLGSATVAPSGSDVTVSIPQLGVSGGSVYVTVTGGGRRESGRVKADYSAESVSAAPDRNNIIVTNNAGKADTVYVSGLNANDIVKVYDAAKGGNLLGTAAAGVYGTDATVTVAQLGRTEGTVYVSVTSPNKSESGRVGADYSGEPSSPSADSSEIVIANNAGMEDTIWVSGLTAGDVIKVYSAASGGSLLGSGTVPASGTEVTVTVAQLGSQAGSVYITVTSADKLESARIKADYPAEARSSAPDAEYISVSNNSGIASTVYVRGLKGNDVVKVYDAATGGRLLGSAVVGVYETEAVVSVSQLGASAGSVYVSVTGAGKLESTRTKADYSAKAVSDAPSASSITIVNNAGIADTVTVYGLEPGTVIKVYTAAAGGSPIGYATVPSGSMKATVTVTQLGTGAGYVYVTATGTGRAESGRTQAGYEAESASDAPAPGSISVVNNSGTADIITVTGLAPYDVVKVYNTASGGSMIASASAESSLTAEISVSQLGTGSGSIYVSVTSVGKTESGRTKVDYAAESAAPSSSFIVIANNAGIPDTVTVSGLAENDVVRVYDAASGGNLLGSAIVPPGSSQAVISIPQLTTHAGSVYITVTNFGRAESNRVKADFIAEQSTTPPYVGDIQIFNNAGIADTITVYNLVPGDVIKVYDAPAGGNLLGYAAVPANGAQAAVSVAQLGTGRGSVYVSVTTKGRLESGRTEALYVSEQTTSQPYVGNISVVNNAGSPDTVTVTGLTEGDVVKVYDAAAGGNLLGIATVAYGKTQAAVSITQIGTSSGSVYVSVTTAGKTESERTKADFIAE